MNKSESNADMMPMTASHPKLKNCKQQESMKPAKTAEVMTDVVTIATPTMRNVRQISV